MCRTYRRKPSPIKVEAIFVMKEEWKPVTEVRRFLGVCAFYHIWIPHYAHITEPLYGLLKKGRKLRKEVYGKDVPIYVTVDTSPTGIGWVISQEDEDGTRFPIWFGAKVLSERHQGYAHVKRELWGIVSVVRADKDYLIGTEMIIEMDCLPILGMLSGCATPDLAMLRWIAYIKSLNPEIRHFSEKDNNMADMLSRVRFDDEDDMVSEDEEVGVDFFE